MNQSNISDFCKYHKIKKFNGYSANTKLKTTHKMIMSYLNNSDREFEVHSWNIIFEHFMLSYALDKQDGTFSILVENRNFEEVASYDMPYGLYGLFQFIDFMELIGVA